MCRPSDAHITPSLRPHPCDRLTDKHCPPCRGGAIRRADMMVCMDVNPYESPQVGAYALGGPTRAKSGFGVDCGCGAVIPVNASQAGATVGRRCGRVVAVPRLSQLRTRAGLAAHE